MKTVSGIALFLFVTLCGRVCTATAGGTNAATSWPIYHGDAALSGIAHTTIPEKPVVRWRYRVGSAVSQPPVVGGGMVFAVGDNGDTHAITLGGMKVWSRGIERDPAASTNKAAQIPKFATPPLFVCDTVVVGSDDGWLYALEASTGKTRWKHRVGESINGTANWLEPEGERGFSVLVISQADGSLHRIDLSSGKAIWVSQPAARSDGSPGVGRDFAVFGSCDTALHFLSTPNGAVIGKIALSGDGQVAGGVAVSGDLVFAGDRGGSIVCADARQNRIVWSNQVARGEAFATPAITVDRVVAGSNDGSVYCLVRDDGRKVWSFDAGDNVLSPVVAGDKVIVSAGGTLYVLGLKDGSKLWVAKAGDTISSPAVVSGSIIVGTDDGFVVMYGTVGP